ncbi:hypothetical protein OH77DRAFT_284098 [Trametes cingulata]|nr:hypothetical protein OH77DRAFT_284098 [Trametes cingulata]
MSTHRPDASVKSQMCHTNNSRISPSGSLRLCSPIGMFRTEGRLRGVRLMWAGARRNAMRTRDSWLLHTRQNRLHARQGQTRCETSLIANILTWDFLNGSLVGSSKRPCCVVAILSIRSICPQSRPAAPRGMLAALVRPIRSISAGLPVGNSNARFAVYQASAQAVTGCVALVLIKLALLRASTGLRSQATGSAMSICSHATPMCVSMWCLF